MQRYNKATAAVIGNALAQAAGAYLGWGPELLGAVSTILTAALVWAVPNKA